MNVYFICVIVRVQMWCVCAQPYVDQTKNFFNRFICIWKCFSSLFVSRFCTYFVFQCFKLGFVLKNKDQSLSRVVYDLPMSCEAGKCIFSIFGHQTETFVSNSQEGFTCKVPVKIPSYLQKFPDQLFYGYLVSFWFKTPHMSLLWLYPLQTLFFKAFTSKPN